MAPQKNLRKTSVAREKWQYHDSYNSAASFNRIVTRSQTAFIRLKNTPSDLDLFADSSRHQPPNAPHLMEKLKGEYGSIPRTIITRSYGIHIGIDDNHCRNIDEYKEFKPSKEVRSAENYEYEIKPKQQTSEDVNKRRVIEELKRKQNEEKAKKEILQDKEEERKKQEAEEISRKKAEAEEAERKKAEAEEEERRKKEAEEQERKEKEAEEEKRKKEDKDDDTDGSGSLFSGGIGAGGFGIGEEI